MRFCLALLGSLLTVASAAAQGPPQPGVVDTPTVKVLRGLTVPEFEAEMQHFVQSLGVTCGTCHVRGNFASDDNPRKLVSRRMIEMTKGINAQFFPEQKSADGQSTLGRVTCFTCHQGAATPKTSMSGH